MNSISINGAARFYEEDGAGPTVILIHCSLGSSRQWRRLTERLRGRFRVLAPDLYAAAPAAATSQSGAQPEGAPRVGDFSFADDCAFVQRLIDESSGRVHVVGHSWGGVIAARSAFDRRARIASLTLIEPSCFHLLDKSGAEYAEIAGVCERGRALLARGDAVGAARLFVDHWMGPGAFAAMPASRREPIVAAMVRLDRDWAGTLDPNTMLDEFRRFEVRTLIVRARDTRRPSARIVELIAAALPNAARVEIASGGHMSPITNPEPVNEAIERFLDGRPQGQS
jgi:pimeloyl-ACP methyl ester carboxylesterase